MKYEITKGSEKDFEGAPEWARFRTSSYFFEGFSEGLSWGYIPSGCNFVSNHGVWRNAESPFQHHINNVIAERRPITEPVTNGHIIGKFVPIDDSSIHRKEFNVLTKEPSGYLAPAWKGIKQDGDEYHVIEAA